MTTNKAVRPTGGGGGSRVNWFEYDLVHRISAKSGLQIDNNNLSVLCNFDDNPSIYRSQD